MRLSKTARCSCRDIFLPLVVSIALLLCNTQLISKPALAQSSSSGNGGGGGAALSASASAGSSSSSTGSSSAAAATETGGGASSSGQVSGSISGSSGSGGASVAASSGSSGSSGSEQASAAVAFSASTTPKPEGGLLDKVKEIFKEGKEAVKSSVENLTKDDKKVSVEASGSIGGGSGSGGGSTSASLSTSGSIGGSSNGASSQASAHVSVGKQEGGGLIDKLSDMAKKGKESIKETASEIKEKAKEVKEDIKQAVGLSDQQGEGVSAGGSIKVGGIQANANINVGGGSSGNQQGGESSGPIEKVQKFVNKGTEVVRETVHRIEDKAAEVTEKVSKTIDDNIRKPMSQVSGSGQQTSEGHMTAQASANVQLRGEAREKHLMDVKRKQESELGQKPSNLKEIITQAKSRGVIPKNEDRSALSGNHADEKSVAVEVLDKMHEIAKMPVETVLKPLDKVLGYEKDPLIRMYDNSHEIIRRPISLVSKPVESMLTGAFKTTDEAKRDYDKLLLTTSEQERREAKMREEKARKEDRSVVGEIADKTVELAEKPFEIILKPVDHALGLDKNGKKNPLLKAFDDFYNLSKKPVDAIAKPFESILRKMADGEQAYQVSVRFQAGQSGGSAAGAAGATTSTGSDSDPKLFTRLADGALNIADRVITKPLEIVMKPLNHALGYDEPGKKNPIVDAAHSLKNATKLGVELFTRPIDRIIKEIAEIGAIKDDIEREAMLERKREEASRLVKTLDKIHELAQSPWEIVLRPVDRVLGISREGRKEPLLRAWDVIHQVVRAPIQVVSKPVEDAILGEQPRYPPGQQRGGVKAQIGGQLGPIKAGASINVGGSGAGSSGSKAQVHEEHKRNFIIESIRKVERLAAKPIDVITSPIRRLILGEDDEKVGSETEKNNRAMQAKAMGQSGNGRVQAQASISGGNGGSDKIVKTLENMNNVVLKPIEVITQPIADILSSDDKGGQKKLDVKIQGQVQSGQSGNSQKKEMSASAQAQVKKN